MVRIDSSLDPVSTGSPAVDSRRVADQAVATPAAVAKPQADRISISSVGAQVMAQAAGIEPYDAAKVASIKTAIKEGRYQIKSDAIAEKILQQASVLSGRQKYA